MGINKAVGISISVLTLLAMLYAGVNHFQTKSDAMAAEVSVQQRLDDASKKTVQAIAQADKDREVGDLETQLRLANLELDYLLSLSHRSAREQTRVALVTATITELEKRLRDLRGVK